MAQYSLPDLRYDYGALQPYISGQIMELHHDKHHAGYVAGANTTLEQLDEARHKGDFTGWRPSSGRWPSTCPDTFCTRCSGKTWRRKPVAGRAQSWRKLWSKTLADSTSSSGS